MNEDDDDDEECLAKINCSFIFKQISCLII